MSSRPACDQPLDDPLEAAMREAFGRQPDGSAPGHSVDSDPAPEPAGGSETDCRERRAASGSIFDLVRRRFGRTPRFLLAHPHIAPAGTAPPGPLELRRDPTRGPRYQVTGEIARGGVGAVLCGQDTEVGRDVAIKVLLERHAGNDVMVRRFLEEARVEGQLEHPGVVPVHEIGFLADARPFFAMKLVKGETLAALLRGRPRPAADRRRFLGIFGKVLETMAYAHAKGVIHRDLKPSNIMVGAFGEVQVMDWGLSKMLGAGKDETGLAGPAAGSGTGSGVAGPAGAEPRSESGSVMGTPSYMPPEQARGEVEKLDERSDVFSLGAILCEILTGGPPFTGASADQVRERAAAARLDDARARLHGSSADRELIDLATRCLAAEPHARPRHAGEVADALSSYLASLDERARAAEIAAAEARVKAAEERRARRLTLALAAAIVLAILAAAAAYLWFEATRRARVARTTAAVTQALEDVASLRGAARASPLEDVAPWDKVRAALERAEAVAAQGDIEPATRTRLASLASEVRQEDSRARAAAAQALKDRAMVERLDGILHQGILSQDRTRGATAAGYEAALRAYGLDIPRLSPEEAAQRIRSSAISSALTAALDHWASSLRTSDARRRLALLHICQQSDPDPLRTRVREALIADDMPALLELSASDGMERSDVRFVASLAAVLEDHEHIEPAIGLLTRTWECQPQSSILAAAVIVPLLCTSPRRTKDALAFARIALSHHPNSDLLWSNYALVLQSDGQHEAAISACQRALALNAGESYPYTILACAFCSRKSYDEATECARKALALCPSSAMCHFNLGQMLHKKGHHHDAVQALKEALRLQPDFAQAHEFLGRTLLAMGDVEGAIRAFRNAVAGKPYDVRTESGRESVGAHDPSAARVRALSQLGAALNGKADVKGAISAFEAARKLRPDDVKTLLNLGAVHEKGGAPEVALGLYRKGLVPDCSRWEVYARIARLTKDRREREAALDAVEFAARQDPKNAKIPAELGSLYRRMDDLEKAARCYEHAAKLDPNSVDVLLRLGRVYARAKRWDDLEAAAVHVLGLDPNCAEARTQLGGCYGQKGLWELAVRELRQAIALAPDSWEAAHNLWFALGQTGRTTEARDVLRSYAAACPGDPRGHLFLGEASRKLGDFDEAIAAFEACLRVDPKNVNALRKLAFTVAEHLDDYELAVTLLQQALEVEPDDCETLMNLGVFRDKKGEFLAAIEALEQVVSVDPSGKRAWGMLGGILVYLDREKGIAALERAIQPGPEGMRAVRNLVAAYIRAGRLQQALELLHRVSKDAGASVGGKATASTRDLGRHEILSRLAAVKRMLQLERDLEQYLRGERTPASADDCIFLSWVCSGQRRYAAAARFLDSVLERSPAEDDDEFSRELRRSAAESAALAAAGNGVDSASLCPDERSYWCRRALEWMEVDLRIETMRAKSGTNGDLWTVVRAVRRWKASPDLAGIRDESALKTLSQADAELCREFWREVDELLARLTAPQPGGATDSPPVRRDEGGAAKSR